MDCVFCKIINGDIPSYTIYEDDNVKAFLDINPDSAGHTLIIPKTHFENVMDSNDDSIIAVTNAAKKLIPILMDKLKADGITVVQNNIFPQEVMHYHVHLKPNYKDRTYLLSAEEAFDIIKKEV